MATVAKKMLEETLKCNDTRQLPESINIMMEIQSDKHPSRLERSRKKQYQVIEYISRSFRHMQMQLHLCINEFDLPDKII